MIVDTLQHIFNKEPKGEKNCKVSAAAVKKWKELGPLNVQKMIDEGLFKVGTQWNDNCERVDAVYNEIKEQCSLGQLDKEKNPNGIVREVNKNFIKEYSIIPGQKLYFMRVIHSTGSWSMGWCLKEAFHSKYHGYHVRYNFDNSIYQRGLHQDGNRAQEYEVKFDKTANYAQSFDPYEFFANSK